MELERLKLKAAEADFLRRFPGGFADPEMQAIGKKHAMGKMVTMAEELFSKKALKDIDASAENMIKMVSRSSMVSMFEKPKFRDFGVSQVESRIAFPAASPPAEASDHRHP